MRFFLYISILFSLPSLSRARARAISLNSRQRASKTLVTQFINTLNLQIITHFNSEFYDGHSNLRRWHLIIVLCENFPLIRLPPSGPFQLLLEIIDQFHIPFCPFAFVYRPNWKPSINFAVRKPDPTLSLSLCMCVCVSFAFQFLNFSLCAVQRGIWVGECDLLL